MRSRAAFSIIAALVLAACGGSTTSPAPSATPALASSAPSMAASEAPTTAPSTPASAAPSTAASATPSAAALDLGSAADSVSQLSSYRMEITQVTGSEQQKLTLERTKTPADASHYVISGPPALEYITIKDQGSWIKQGSSWTAVPGGGNPMASLFDALAPDTIISGFQLNKYADHMQLVDTKQHNGVQAAHYHVDAALAGQLGAVGFPADGNLDIWVAVDGGYMVGMAYGGTSSTGDHEEVTIEVTRVNDPTLVIEAPAQS